MIESPPIPGVVGDAAPGRSSVRQIASGAVERIVKTGRRALLAQRMAELGVRVEEVDRRELETTQPKREEEETPAIKSLIPRERLRELL